MYFQAHVAEAWNEVGAEWTVSGTTGRLKRRTWSGLSDRSSG